LEKLASIIVMLEAHFQVPICKSYVVPPFFEKEDCEEVEYCAIEVFDVEKEDWLQPFVDYLKYDKLPNDPHLRVDVDVEHHNYSITK